jgi:hypothetical protein
MKTARLASATAETWNQKNLPSDTERLGETQEQVLKVIRQVPSAALGLVRRRPGAALLVAAIVAGALGTAWFFSNRD